MPANTILMLTYWRHIQGFLENCNSIRIRGSSNNISSITGAYNGALACATSTPTSNTRFGTKAVVHRLGPKYRIGTKAVVHRLSPKSELGPKRWCTVWVPNTRFGTKAVVHRMGPKYTPTHTSNIEDELLNVLLQILRNEIGVYWFY